MSESLKNHKINKKCFRNNKSSRDNQIKKNEIKIYNKNNIYNKYFILFINLISILVFYISLLIPVFSQSINNLYNRKLSTSDNLSIKLIIKGTGPQKIINPNFNKLPSSIKVNGTISDFLNSEINLDQEINEIILQWDNKF